MIYYRSVNIKYKELPAHTSDKVFGRGLIMSFYGTAIIQSAKLQKVEGVNQRYFKGIPNNDIEHNTPVQIN